LSVVFGPPDLRGAGGSARTPLRCGGRRADRRADPPARHPAWLAAVL